MELAYRIAVEDAPLYDAIRKNVIVMATRPASRTDRSLRRLVLQVQAQRRR